ncbi:hypothetical protein [Verrucomicrobium spinosum]|uniref:hypothetical protein n=1 Tax=Verrucomicrobium spinosum TaxID=2736 RepID=UPI000A5B6911|nr:hypothetical protein [Verrucomicrobium spinosum]
MKPLLIILAAGLWIGASTASAQVLIANALDRTPSETVTQTTLVATVGTTTNSNLGAGWNASNTFAGVLSTQTMTLNPGIADDSGGLFQIAQGGVAGVAGSFSATKRLRESPCWTIPPTTSPLVATRQPQSPSSVR